MICDAICAISMCIILITCTMQCSEMSFASITQCFIKCVSNTTQPMVHYKSVTAGANTKMEYIVLAIDMCIVTSFSSYIARQYICLYSEMSISFPM